MAKRCLWLKIVSLSLFCVLNVYLFVISCGTSYQYEMAREHVRFREQMPGVDTWHNSPFGKLKAYLFNVTNAEEFLSGRDARVKLQQVGPIVYKILGNNEVINRTATSVTFRKQRYRHVQFLAEESASPDILNQTIVQFNNILLGAAAKCNEIPFAWMGFNPLTYGEDVFIPGSVYYFLWELTRPTLDFFSKFVPLNTNCGTLYNAFNAKDEIYTVNIGTDHGVENFFRIQSYNGESLIQERVGRNQKRPDPSCPIDVRGTHENSMFPHFLRKDTPLSITASEACRVLPLHYQREQEAYGLNGYRYTLLKPNETTPSCMDSTYGVRLPRGMFDLSKCVINDAPTACSSPHFYGTSYDWRRHFEGLNPNAEEHEPAIVLEPITGVPLTENYRFMASTPLPDMKHFNTKLQKLQDMIVPNFWYEFELGELTDLALFLIRCNVKVMPVLQPILMALQLLAASWSLYSLWRLCRSPELGTFWRRTNVQLETIFTPTSSPQNDANTQAVK